MKHLLAKDFSSHFDKSGTQHPVLSHTKQGLCKFGDSVACNSCPEFFKINGCDNSVFVADFPFAVTQIEIEAFIKSFKNIQRKKCDLLFYDKNKIVLADMYCGDIKYLEKHTADGTDQIGKRATVELQIKATLDLLYQVDTIKDYIDSKSEKVGIMAYRNKYEGLFEHLPNAIKSSANAFLRPTTEMSRRRITKTMAHGFTFICYKYPDVYQW